ncbi:hypothetical protein NA56DRAFT_733552 [Hyaloscypha hepaticicola]|uniref:Uncharacterized protein n=1 Tax=Hyaloscypha hepaticicola TaxID=2082293 RepID=A0A2J6PNH6_9HELO|nr:hypothetical protein NA56DRAFT_733552 [Hyaloscypha hepaticicola]
MLLIVPLLYAVAAAAAVAEPRGACNHDNCLRVTIAVIASAFTDISGPIDCSSYLSATVTPAVPPGSPTVTVCNAVLAGETLIPPAPTVIPSHIPSYASACSGSVRYSSACECVSVSPVTTTVPTPTAFTVSHTSVVAAAPTLNAVQFYNGFVCDPTDNILTDTPAPLDVCTETTLSYSLNFASFVPAGGLTAMVGHREVRLWTQLHVLIS